MREKELENLILQGLERERERERGGGEDGRKDTFLKC